MYICVQCMISDDKGQEMNESNTDCRNRPPLLAELVSCHVPVADLEKNLAYIPHPSRHSHLSPRLINGVVYTEPTESLTL
jgi:hypothetical protein